MPLSNESCFCAHSAYADGKMMFALDNIGHFFYISLTGFAQINTIHGSRTESLEV